MPEVQFAIESDVYRLDWSEAGIVAAVLGSFRERPDSPDLLRLGALGPRVSEVAGPLCEAMDAVLAGELSEPIDVDAIRAEALVTALAAAGMGAANRREPSRLRVALESLSGRRPAAPKTLPPGDARLSAESYDF